MSGAATSVDTSAGAGATGSEVPAAQPGARLLADGRCAFRVWAPFAERVEVRLLGPPERVVALEPRERGYHDAVVADVADGARYFFRLDGGRDTPDPAARCQPDGVHGPSAVVAPDFDWQADGWRGLPLDAYVLYELHVGTFTPAGTFDAAAERLEELRDLGITAVELMPVAQFPGERNWGYDGVYPYAVQQSYGGPRALKRFIDRCHTLGIAAVLDVVYNHLGPEGNYLSSFGPYFNDRYHTPWGSALNFDAAGSDEVRAYFIGNALQWTREYRFDALRLDAVHAILDTSAQPFLQQLATRVHEAAAEDGRTVLLFAESDLGDPRMLRGAERGGMGMDAQWLDDFHHALHALLTGERTGYYADFGELEQLARCYREGYSYAGRYSTYRQRSHGAPAPDIAPRQFVVCAQNHDQVGNRMNGERLSALLEPDQLRLAALATVLAPFTPLLFMGEEYGETAPFPYFVSHTDPELIAAVRTGRREEFAAFAWAGQPPDPQAVETFRSALLRPELRERSPHRELYAFYRELLIVRALLPQHPRMDDPQLRVDVAGTGNTLIVRRRGRTGASRLVLHFGADAEQVACDAAPGRWQRRIDSLDTQWGGPGSGLGAVLDSRAGRLDLALQPYHGILLTLDTGH